MSSVSSASSSRSTEVFDTSEELHPVLVADPVYKLAISADDLRALGLSVSRQPKIGSEVLVLTLLSIREDAPATANLLAPVVVNVANHRAVQAIRLDAAYSHEQPLVVRNERCTC